MRSCILTILALWRGQDQVRERIFESEVPEREFQSGATISAPTTPRGLVLVELLSGSNFSVKIDYGANSDLGSHLAQIAPKSVCTLEFDPESSSTNLNRWGSPIPSSATILVGFRAPRTVRHGLESICYHSYDLSITMFN